MFFKKEEDKVKNNFIVKVCALLIHAAKIDENYTKNEEKINLFFVSVNVKSSTFTFPINGKSIFPSGPIIYDPSISSVSVKLIEIVSAEPNAYAYW